MKQSLDWNPRVRLTTSLELGRGAQEQHKSLLRNCLHPLKSTERRGMLSGQDRRFQKSQVSTMSSSNDESRKRLCPDEPPETYRIDEIVAVCVNTLSDDMAGKAYGIRHKRQPTPSELTEFKEQLIREHYDDGFDQWVEKYLYYDPRKPRT